MKIETKKFTKKARDYDLFYDGSYNYSYYDKLIIQIFRFYYEKETDCYASRTGFSLFTTGLFGKHKSLFGFNLSGFRKTNKPNHLRATLFIDLFYRKFWFNIGLADKGWFYVRWVDLSSFLRKLHFKLTSKKGNLDF